MKKRRHKSGFYQKRRKRMREINEYGMIEDREIAHREGYKWPCRFRIKTLIYWQFKNDKNIWMEVR